jgi:hypothetical protein
MTFEQRAAKETEETLNVFREHMRYDPATGDLWWRFSGSGRYLDRPAGKITVGGYVKVILKRKEYFAHRVAWALQTGNWPKFHIDHINGVKNDNRFINLRDVPQTINMQNMHVAYGEIPYIGVSRNGTGFRAQVCINGISKHIGTYRTPEEARDAREQYLLNLRNPS